MDFQESTKVAVKPAVIYDFSDRFQIPLELSNLQCFGAQGQVQTGVWVHAPLPGPGGHPCPASLGTQIQASLVFSAPHIPFFEGGKGKIQT